MNAGYFIEQDLMYQTDAYSATVQPSDEKSTLQKEVEDNEDIDCLTKTLLKQAILTCLKMAVGDCAKHECHGCKMNHPKIVNEYDQEIPQSQTATNPVAP